MAGNLITSLLSLSTYLLPSFRASAQAPSSSSNSSNSHQRRARSAKEDLERLMRTLKWIKATMYDAEEREITDRSVNLWLKELKKVAYDAEDVLSEYRYEVTRVQVEARQASEASRYHKGKQIESVEYIVPIPDDMVDRLNKIRSRFDDIAKDREALQLRESDGVRRPNTLRRVPAGHMVDEASIFGRDVEIREIINFLLSEKKKQRKKKSFSVISIVGKGGLGKTTIAQLVYKDPRVSKCFDLFGWVCVSEEFDVGRLIKATIESLSTKINNGVSELSPLQEELSKIVKDKTIFLILDDVWNENQGLWELFWVCFEEAKWVIILVTTRNNKVAKVMQTKKLFRPSNLPESSCWQLFQHYAFSSTSDNVPTNLIDMGREIMRKCGGLPLAVKSIASLLRHETYEKSWREILESDLWESNPSNDIFPALQISYAHLPAHLKPCFLICSMYPKDHLLKKMHLIELWISHGYVVSRGNLGIIQVGIEYYEELKERSFLDNYSGRSSEFCKLHDIIHDLARLISENEHYSVEINHPLDIQEENVPREAYHLYARGFLGYVNQMLQQNRHNLIGLKTLSTDLRGCIGDLEHRYCINNYIEDLEHHYCINKGHMLSEYHKKCWQLVICNLTKFEALRVLELKGYGLTVIPHSISKLKHLAYLSITSSSLKILSLSIGLLYNLKALILNCFFLEYLPENIGDLANLQFLSVRSGTIQELPKSVCSLRNLLRLVIKSNKLLDYGPHGLVTFPAIKTMRAGLRTTTLSWLKDMKDLEGKLSIAGLENMINLLDAKSANLRNKCRLETLDLCWNSENNNTKSELILSLIPETCEGRLVGADDLDFSLLECLQPHPNLKKLLLRWYPCARLPKWMKDPFSLQSIQQLLLECCISIQSLPFGNLHTLKHLTIVSCSGIQVLQLGQLSSQLRALHILECDHLELITGLGHLDMLAELEICSCKALQSLTINDHFGASSPEKPYIDGETILSLTRLEIRNCDLLRVFPNGLISNGPCSICVLRCGCPDVLLSSGRTLRYPLEDP
ncbi:putative disease resistance protein RGA3 [Carex rostrata]